jgi:hypothetical protein
MNDFPSIEFFREGYGMLADARDKDPGAPICFPRPAGGRAMTGYCTCHESKKGSSCPHYSELVGLAAKIKKQNRGRSPGEVFAGIVWFRLAALLSEGDLVQCAGDALQRSW